MDIFKELKKAAIEPSLKKFFFKKYGKVWTYELNSGIVYIVEVGINAVVKNDFLLSIRYGIYFQGVMELLYGFPFEIKHGVGNCIFHGSVDKKKIKQLWNSNDFLLFESFKDDVSDSLENGILPFLNKFNTGEQLIGLFNEDFSSYIKNDSILALKIGCLKFLVGQKEQGITVVEQVIANSKVKFDFAEAVLMRMKN